MEAPKCPFCGEREWRHVCGQGSNVASKPAKAVVERTRSSNFPGRVRQEDAVVVRKDKKQGWSRKAYNAYQRVYLMTWRAVRAGRADWWPRKSMLKS